MPMTAIDAPVPAIASATSRHACATAASSRADVAQVGDAEQVAARDAHDLPVLPPAQSAAAGRRTLSSAASPSPR